MKCKICNEQKTGERKDLCGKCYAKEWRKNNPEKIKEYLKRRKQHIRIRNKKYNSRPEVRAKVKEANKKYKNYKENDKWREYELSKDRRKREGVRNKTRLKFPLDNKKCKLCGSKAVNRHHTTEPMEVDKFIFVCFECHNKIHFEKIVLESDAPSMLSEKEKGVVKKC